MPPISRTPVRHRHRAHPTPPRTHHATEHRIRAHANVYGVPISAEYTHRSVGGTHHSEQEPVMGSSSSGRNSVTHSVIKHPSKSSSKSLKGASRNEYQTVRYGAISTLQGKQVAANLFILNDYVAWQSAFAGALLAYDIRESSVTINNTTIDTKASVLWTKMDYEFMNHSNHQCTLDLYELSLKHDMSTIDPVALWNYDLQNEALAFTNVGLTPTFSLSGFTTAAGGTPTPPRKQLSTDPGAVPEQSEAFKRIFKVEKRTKVILGSGDVHSHKVFYSNPKLLSKEDWDNASGGGQNNGLKNYTGITMAILRGVPAQDTQATGFSTNLSPAQVNYMCVIKQCYAGASKPIPLKKGITEFLSIATADTLQVEEPSLQPLTAPN